MDIDNILGLLWDLESAPSAHILVKSIFQGEVLSVDEINEIYNCTEGYNDTQTVGILKKFSKEQFNDLIFDLTTRETDDEEDNQQ